MFECKSLLCDNPAAPDSDFCYECQDNVFIVTPREEEPSLAQKYPKYYKPVGQLTEIDVYAVHKLFEIEDPSGAIQHASKKLLLSGVRTGNKSKFKDILEARDTLNRWIELNPEHTE